MGQSLLVTAEEHATPPILIIDKEGSLGLGLCSKLQQQTQVVLVSNREPDVKENTLFLPFSDTTPEIPEEQYSHMLYVLSDEKKEAEILYACIKKAQRDGSFFSLIIDKRKLKKNPFEYIPHAMRYANVLIVGDIFDVPVHKKHAFVIEHLFEEARTKKSLQLPNVGLVKLYPVGYADAVTAILKVALANTTAQQLFLLYPSFAVTELGIARAMQKIEPSLKIDFTNDTTEQVADKESEQGEFVLPQDYPVFSLLEKAFREYLEEKGSATPKSAEQETFSTPLIPSLSKKNNEKKQKPALRVWISLLAFIITILLLPYITSFGSLQVAKLFLLSAKNQAFGGSLLQAQNSLQAATSAISFSQASSNVLALEASIPAVASSLLSLQEQQRSLTALASGGKSVASAVSLLQLIIEGKQNASLTDIQEAIQQARNGYTQLQTVETASILPKDTTEHLKQALASMTPAINTLDILPSALGFQGEKTYLVLFQNNMELRPGGGFVGSYGLVTFEKGRVKNFTIHDVYEADGQLRGHVEPPFPIRRYMGVVHLYLRDSTFDVDFTKDAFIAAQMLHLETGQTVDGVIGLDLSFIKNMLTGIGPVAVPDYQQTVTSDNFFQLTETHAEKGFFPGSTQKKDFLTSVYTGIQQKLKGKNLSYEKIAQAVLESIAQKHILFASAHASEQDVLTANNLSSTLWDPRPAGQINDFVGINEANIGVNKVNYFIKRQVTQHVVLSPAGDITGDDTITLTNTSTPQDTFAGQYTSYLRFIVPENADLTAITVDGQKQTIIPAVTDFLVYEKKSFVPPLGLEVDKTTESGKSIYGMYITVGQQKARTVTLSYTIKQAVAVGSPTATYSMMFFKQPGVDEIPYTFSFAFPPFYQILSASKEITQSSQQASMQTTLSQDTTFSLYLGKK